MKIMTTNMNGYCHTLSNHTFNDRSTLTFSLYRKNLPDIWALQEVLTGKGMKCLKHLQRLSIQQGYSVILPQQPSWEPKEHPRSIQNILLLKNINEIKVLSIDDIELVNRVNFVRATFNQYPDKEFYIINVHVPQTAYFPGHKPNDGYVRYRKHLSYRFFEVLHREVSKLSAENKRVILIGDFNKTLDNECIKNLLESGFVVASNVADNTYFCPAANIAESVDHIFLSSNIIAEGTVSNCVVDTDFVNIQKLSDHATVSLDLDIAM